MRHLVDRIFFGWRGKRFSLLRNHLPDQINSVWGQSQTRLDTNVLRPATKLNATQFEHYDAVRSNGALNDPIGKNWGDWRSLYKRNLLVLFDLSFSDRHVVTAHAASLLSQLVRELRASAHAPQGEAGNG